MSVSPIQSNADPIAGQQGESEGDLAADPALLEELVQTEQLATEVGHRWRQRRWPRVVSFVVGLVPAVEVLSLVRGGVVPVAGLLAWVLLTAGRGGLRRQVPLASDLRAGLTIAVVLSLASVAGLVGRSSVRDALAVVGAAVASTLALRLFELRPPTARRVVLVGASNDVESYAATGLGSSEVVGCFIVDSGTAVAVPPDLSIPTTTSIETIVDLVASNEATDVLVLPGAGVDGTVVRRLSWIFENADVNVGVVCPVDSVGLHRLRPSIFGTTAVLQVAVPRASTATRLVKAVLDRVGAAVLLLLVSPVLALMWVAVRLDSPGPGFFVQNRMGRLGVPFRMYKMRTMHMDAESLLATLVEDNESDGVLFKIRRDPRVTRIGYWLRRSSLDELPQLVNVLLGHMSLVGPRPALASEVAVYDETARRRLAVKPGLTGLWQVSGRSDLPWEESLRLDLYYVDNWRLFEDLRIAARTPSAVTRARGAY
jgi:exopolysaccharide biosynthesis polyprenyl glycosylphosphotransferase